MTPAPSSDAPAERRYVTRAVEVTLDPSPSQQRWLRSYAGSMRSVYNWAIAEASARNELRTEQRDAGVAEEDLPPALWSAAALSRHWRSSRDESHPWHTEVSIHAFETGLNNAAAALKNFFESRASERKGRRVGFPRFKNRHSHQSVTFSEGHVDHHHWINQDTKRHVRLMLPQRASDDTWERHHTRAKSEQPKGRDRRTEVAWIRAHQGDAVAEVWALCEAGAAQVQALTLKFDGGRWKAVFRLRVFTDVGNEAGRLRNPGAPVKWHGGAVGVDLGFEHLATLDRPIAGLTDEHGHVPNPRPLVRNLDRLARIDKAIARCQKGSKNRAKLIRRRQLLHGRVAATRKLYLHELTRRLASGFDVVCIEDLELSGMTRRKGMRLGKSVSDAALGELVGQLDQKTTTSATTLIKVGRFYPSSKTCSACGAVRTKLPLHVRIFDCTECGVVLNRDVNAARNIQREGLRLLREQLPAESLGTGGPVASIRGETRNDDPRTGETQPARSAGGHGPLEDATVPASPPRVGSRDLAVATV
jgi:putative transposase